MSPTTSKLDPPDGDRLIILKLLEQLPSELLSATINFLRPRDLLALLRATPSFVKRIPVQCFTPNDIEDFSILHVLAATDNKSELLDEILLLSHVDLNSKCKRGHSILSYAIFYNNEKATEALLKQKDVDATSCCPLLGHRTPLTYAIKQEEKRLIDLLLDREGVNVAQPDSRGKTPLSYAAEKGDAVLTKRLLPHYTDIGQVDDEGEAAISYAASSGSKEVVELLLSQPGVDANQSDNEGCTPLLCAYTAGSKEVVELLLSQDGVKADQADGSGRTPIFYACFGGSKELVELLLSQDGVDADQADGHDRTPLSYAAEKGNTEVVKLLLSKDNIKADQVDSDGYTPLSYAAGNGNKEVVELLLSQDNINQADRERRTLLLCAAENGYKEVVKLLLSKDNIKADQADRYGRTPLSYAAENGDKEVVELLLSKGNIKADQADADRRTPLSYAVEKQHEEVVRLLTKPDLYPGGKYDYCREPLLRHAVGKDNEKIVELLLPRPNVDAETRTSNNRLALFKAVRQGSAAVVKLLLLQPNVDADERDNKGRTPLSYAAERGVESVARLLLDEYSVSAHSRCHRGMSPLVYAAASGKADVIPLLLNRGREAEAVEVTDPFPELPLVHAARCQSPRIVRLLIDCYDKKPNKATSLFCWGLHHAVVCARPQAVKMLLDQLNGRVPRPEGRLLKHMSMLSELVQTHFAEIQYYRTDAPRQVRNHELVVNTMLGNRDDELTNMDKKPPLYIALRCQVFVAQMLLDRADAGEGWSRYHFPWPESRGAFAKYEDIVRKLLAKRDEQTAQLRRDNLTPLPWAAADPELESYFRVVWQLLHAPEPAVNIVDPRGFTELFYALGLTSDADMAWLLEMK